MDISTQFNRISKEYDAKRKLFIPCFDDFYINSTNFIAFNITKPNIIIDLGAGTGILTSYWYRHFPEAQYILIDIADEMLKIAKDRFVSKKNISYLTENYSMTLPDIDADVVISALSIHHLEDDKKSILFRNIYNTLYKGSIFVNYDQFCADNKLINQWYTKFWEDYLYHNGLTEYDLNLWKERKKLDRECSVSKEIAMLSASGFANCECIFSCHKFSVIVAIK